MHSEALGSHPHCGPLGVPQVLDSLGPLLLGWAGLGYDSSPTPMAAPHTSSDLTHCSLSPAGRQKPGWHPATLPPNSDWLSALVTAFF